MNFRNLIFIACLLCGCATPPAAPIEERGAAGPAQRRPDAAPQGVAQPDLYEQTAPAMPLENPGDAADPAPAIVALVDESDRKLQSGEPEAAAATIERALRIDPSDPHLWHKLAEVRLGQGRAVEAESLAAKSNSLAAGEPALQSANWNLIARARSAAGDDAGAAEASRRAAAVNRE